MRCSHGLVSSRRRTAGSGPTPKACASAWDSPRHCSATRGYWCWTSRPPGWTRRFASTSIAFSMSKVKPTRQVVYELIEEFIESTERLQSLLDEA